MYREEGIGSMPVVRPAPATGVAAAAVDGFQGRGRRFGRILLRIGLAALAWRAISAFAAFLANVVFPLDQPQVFSVFSRPHYFWDALARYDAGWYFGIARNGYQFIEGGRNNLAYFPAYPVTMGYLGYFMGGGQSNYYIAGMIISWLAFAGAMVMLYRLARLDLDHDASTRACVYAAVFPFAFFFGAVYPTSLFLFLSVTTFYAFRKGHWLLGALAGALVTCTRVNGILILPALAWIVYQHWRSGRGETGRAAAALAAVPLGLVGYSLYTYSLSGSFIEYASSIQRWNYTPGQLPSKLLATLITGIGDLYHFLTVRATGPYDFLNGTAAAVAVVAVPFIWRRFGAPYALYVAANLALPLSSNEFEGLGRYTAVMFPLFLWLATFRTTLAQTGILCTFAMFYMLCQALFVNLHPIF